VIGCLTGAGVTAMVQSSSATTVMLIGFVSAGLMTLQQAVGVILGANVGTTVTAQLIAFKLTEAALPAIAIGVIMKFFTRQKKFRYWGEVILGFGLLFFGMDVMKHGLAPIKEDPAFLEFFTKFDPSTVKGLLLSVLVGAALTIMVQSSSATIGLTMTLATQGLLTFPGAMALVLGENIGTTITAELATIGSNNINAHRAARAHTMFNVIGVCLMLLIFPVFTQFITFITQQLGTGPADVMVKGEAVNISRYIANGHTMFNVLNACFFLIFLPWLIKVAILLAPKAEKSDDFFRLPTFGSRMIDTPIAAIAEARSEIRRMAGAAISTFSETVQRIEDRDYKRLDAWKENEHFIDGMQREITAYLTRISQSDVGDAAASEISSMMRMTNNIERIGDSVENIAQATEKLIEEKLKFTPTAMADIKEISKKVMEFLQLVSEGMYKHDKDFMKMAEEIENAIDDMREEMRDSHICRLRKGECNIEPGLIFINLLTNFEKIGDYCFNIAEAVAGLK
jgi:phosphate:Na+ symporter